MNREVRRWAKLLVGILATILFSWIFLRHLDWGTSAAVLADARPSYLIVAIGLLATGYALRILRWWIMLRSMAPGLSFRSCAGPFLSGMALNNILPFRAGDIVRTIGFRQQLELPPAQVLSTLIMERLFDLTALLIVFFISLWGIAANELPKGFLQAVYLLTTGCVVLLLVCFFMPAQIERWIRSLASAASRRGASVVGHAGMGAAQVFSSLTLMRSPLLVLQLFGLSLGVWLFEGAMFAAVAQAIAISDAGLGTWFALATGTLATLIPSTPGYVGTFDYFTMLGLTMYDVPDQIAAVFAMAVHVMLWVPVTLVGLLWFFFLKLGTMRIKRTQPMDIST